MNNGLGLAGERTLVQRVAVSEGLGRHQVGSSNGYNSLNESIGEHGD